MPRRADISIPIVGAAALLASGCATDDWGRMRDEFAEVRANCRLRGTILERDREDPRLLRLIFRQRNAEEIAAEADGRLACARLWAGERGYRLVTGGA